MVTYACGFNQSETGKYFEGILKLYIIWLAVSKQDEPIPTLWLATAPSCPLGMTWYVLQEIASPYAI